MRKSLLAGALALALGSTLLAPVAEARDRRSRHRGHGYRYGYSHRPYKPYYRPYYRPYYKPYRGYYGYRPHGYYDGYYDGYYPYAPPDVYFHFHGGVRCSRPHVGVHFGF